MYFVDREKIEQTLGFIEQLTKKYLELDNGTSSLHDLALERIAYLLIESFIDVGNAMIDGFIMRDPGSYEDIIDILEDEKVLSNSAAQSLKAILTYRKSLVQDYINVDHQALKASLQKELDTIQSFPNDIRKYLENELGPVSAFIPRQQ
jgi:uncharacterized protein YutE (UPF0331/DUF86 family)